MRVLITGGGGFIGRALCAELGVTHDVTASFRTEAQIERRIPAVQSILVEDIGPATDWKSHLQGIDVVVHLAARAHVLHETDRDPAALFQHTNVLGAEHLARNAAQAGVRRFIFVSSVGVYGRKYYGVPLTELLDPLPVEPYAVSKWQAELALCKIALETAMDVVTVRPPLVYGPAVQGNFRRLLEAIKRQMPLPFGCAQHPQSLIGIGNLVSFLRHCIESADSSGQTFVVSDGEDVGLASLCKLLSKSMNLPSRLLPIPRSAFWLAAQLTGQKTQFDRVFRPLTIDSTKARVRHGWCPPFTLAEGLSETAKWFTSM